MMKESINVIRSWKNLSFRSL